MAAAGVTLSWTDRLLALRDRLLAALPNLPVIDKIAERLGAKSEGERAAAVELALEALYLAKKIDKSTDDGETVYG